jgi:uncharacterized protein (TIGR03437 family)
VLIASLRRAVAAFTCLAAFAGPSLAANEPELDTEEREFLRLINEYRAQHGLQPLVNSGVLSTAANWMSGDMGAKAYFAHNEPGGRAWNQRLADFGYDCRNGCSENILAGTNWSTAAIALDKWKNSPSHNANMLNASFKVIGIGRAFVRGSPYGWYWTTDFGGFVDPSAEGGAPVARINAIVSAASYAPNVARGSIASLFGESLATGPKAASVLPLPKDLGGTVVKLRGQPVELFYVSPNQINFSVPVDALPGLAPVEVVVNGKASASFSLNLQAIAPGLFTAGADGKGAAVGGQTFDGVRQQPLTNNDRTARRVDAGTLERPSYLSLYGTGWRNVLQRSDVRVTIAGYDAEVQYAGAQGTYVGLDQLNVKVPYVLRGAGEVELVMTVGTSEANRVRVAFE